MRSATKALHAHGSVVMGGSEHSLVKLTDGLVL